MINSIDAKMIKPLLADLLSAKQGLTRINGIITKLAELAFIDFLRNRDLINDNDARRQAECSLMFSAYANGYDVCIPESKIAAEIKALIPYERVRFGGAQIQSLEKDVEGLLHPEKKSKAQVNTRDYRKFLVLLSSQDEESFSEAVSHLKERLSKKGYAVTDHLPADNEELSLDTVYIVTIPLD